MTNLPPPTAAGMPAPPNRDADHLRVLAIFHFVFAALTVAGIGFLFVHYLFFSTMMGMPEAMANAGNLDPEEAAEAAQAAAVMEPFMNMAILFYTLLGVLFVIVGLLNLLAGRGLLKRQLRTLTFITAGLNCLSFPFGTVLGVFTIIVLMRPTVGQLYGISANPGH